VELEVMDFTASQVAVAEAEEQVAEDPAEVELEAHKLLITLEEQAVMAQAQAVEEIITQVEMVKREVLA
jgi:hypothetical protein